MAKERLTLSDSVVNEVFTILFFILYKLIGGEASSFDLSQELVVKPKHFKYSYTYHGNRLLIFQGKLYRPDSAIIS